MRIIAGIHKSRRLETLEGLNTRPMTDRMKESVFNTIGPYFDGDIVLDLFGGSGALTLEAISRGAKYGVVVEKDYKAAKIITQNITSLKEESKVMLLNIDYRQALKKFTNENKQFDIIFLDPPYRMNIINEIVDYVLDNNLLSPSGILVCQYVRGNFKNTYDHKLTLIKNYNYASSELSILQLKS